MSSTSFVSLFSFVIAFSIPFSTYASESGAPQFDYSNPARWGDIAAEYSVCKTARRQSPIFIDKNAVVLNPDLKPLNTNYRISYATLLTNGREVKVMFEADGGLEIDGKLYALQQMHWHTPSEHRIGSTTYEAELHIVHQAVDGTRAVIGVVYKSGRPDPILNSIMGELNELGKQECPTGHEVEIGVGDKLDIKLLVSQYLTRKYYRYPGSLTTPPCDENVTWTVLAKVHHAKGKRHIHHLPQGLPEVIHKPHIPIRDYAC